MKKKLLTILITSLVMIAGMGAFLWKMNSVNRQQEKKKAALLQEEMDTDTKDKALEDVDKLELQTLYLSGDKKNVVTREYGKICCGRGYADRYQEKTGLFRGGSSLGV